MKIDSLKKRAPEQGSYTIKFTFRDYLNVLIEAAAITELYYWVTDYDGRVVNSLSEVEITSITNPCYLTLNGDDLQLFSWEDDYADRVVTLKGLYNSTFGDNLSLTYSVHFEVENLLVIAMPLYASTIDVVFVREGVN